MEMSIQPDGLKGAANYSTEAEVMAKWVRLTASDNIDTQTPLFPSSQST